MNLPNRITVYRFFLSIAYFGLLIVVRSAGPRMVPWLLDGALAIFILASITDALDGYFARKYGMATDFGRVADPFVDKIMICGSFVFFLTIPPLSSIIAAWMVVIVLAREFLVQGLRSLAESKGIAFGSSIWGKQKMIVQCVVVGCCLFYAAHLSGFEWATAVIKAMVWLALITTVVSGLAYVHNARKLFGGTS
jgi:CDP-diacylglycerol--glycerol-3-phosphate 3-phosphatidyltransferase